MHEEDMNFSDRYMKNTNLGKTSTEKQPVPKGGLRLQKESRKRLNKRQIPKEGLSP